MSLSANMDLKRGWGRNLACLPLKGEAIQRGRQFNEYAMKIKKIFE